jgi:RNA polymerase sigma-70 factor (sigma-E family)
MPAGLNPPMPRLGPLREMNRRHTEEAEFRSFVTRFSPALLNTAALLLRDRDAAEDATQSALLRTFRRWDRARVAPEAFSQRVLINVCHNHWRHQRRHPLEAAPAEETIGAGSPASEGDRVDQRLEIREALATLPAHQREVLVLRFFLDFSVPQTAQLLEIPEGTVKSATHRGLSALRACLSHTQEVHDGR